MSRQAHRSPLTPPSVRFAYLAVRQTVQKALFTILYLASLLYKRKVCHRESVTHNRQGPSLEARPLFDVQPFVVTLSQYAPDNTVSVCICGLAPLLWLLLTGRFIVKRNYTDLSPGKNTLCPSNLPASTQIGLL